MSLIATDKHRVVIGLGKTGYSVVSYFARKGIPVVAMDTRENPPFANQVKSDFPDVKMLLGGLDADVLANAEEIIVSPGLSLKTPEIVAASEKGIRVIGDIQIFAEHANAPIIAITGSNAKSTVTTLVGEMAKQAGKKVAVGGNLGVPALDLLDDQIELYVMELSSFQLETTSGLKAKVATVLNVSPDHLDRYDSYLEYHQAKHRIFKGCETAVVNKDDPLSAPMVASGLKLISFSAGQPDINEYGLISHNDEIWLAKFNVPLLEAKSLKIKGLHNYTNALAALAIGEAAGLPMEAMKIALLSFSGLEHRCQWIRNINGVDYFNDSKGTNVGATEAALNGLGPEVNGKIILLLGGEGKGADFSELKSSISKYVAHIFAFGRDKKLIEHALSESVPLTLTETMQEAVVLAQKTASQGDAVLLSPACASFDMFKNFEVRGTEFIKQVNAL